MLVECGIFCMSVLSYVFCCRHKRTIPKNMTFSRPPSSHRVRSSTTSPLRNGYSIKKVPDNIDVIVIGSGISGLTCAGLLSKAGKRVLVLEQHYIAGGCTHTYTDQGFEFDTGLHYIGNVHKRQPILDLITDTPVEWDKIGSREGENGTYDVIQVGDHTFNLRPGRAAFLEEVGRHFLPNEVKNVARYLDYVETVANQSLFFHLKICQYPWLVNWVNRWKNKLFFQSTTESAYDVVCRFTSNPLLRTFLCGQFGGYGRSPKEESFFLHASYVHHYLKGGWYPRGGCSVLAEKIIPTIEKNGGAVLVRKRVRKIMLDPKNQNRAIGVQMENGDELLASTIISGVGVLKTWKSLVGEQNIPASINDKLVHMANSSSMLYLTVGLSESPSTLSLPSHNLWIIPDESMFKCIEESAKDLLSPNFPMFIGFPCAKDSTWDKRFPQKSTAVIMLMCNYEMFQKWQNDKYNKRSPEYKEFKDTLVKHILKYSLHKHFPQTHGHIVYAKLGTPLTFNHYIGSTEGECYGIGNSKERFRSDDWLTPHTPIDGLYLTGQDIMTMGVTGALMGGVLTAHSVLNYGTLTDMATGRNLITDLQSFQSQ